MGPRNYKIQVKPHGEWVDEGGPRKSELEASVEARELSENGDTSFVRVIDKRTKATVVAFLDGKLFGKGGA